LVEFKYTKIGLVEFNGSSSLSLPLFNDLRLRETVEERDAHELGAPNDEHRTERGHERWRGASEKDILARLEIKEYTLHLE